MRSFSSDASTLTKEPYMLWTIFVILLVLRLLGMMWGYTMGGLIHLLLLLAIAAVVLRIIQGRRPAELSYMFPTPGLS